MKAAVNAGSRSAVAREPERRPAHGSSGSAGDRAPGARGAPFELLLEEARTWNPELVPAQVAVIRTEPHVLSKYRWLADASLRTIDLSARRDGAGGVAGRLLAARRVGRDLRHLKESDLAGVAAFILDVSEGWFATAVNYQLRRLFPGAVLIGLQHGAMELSGLESRPWVRRARVLASATQCALLGGAVFGAGFGNNPFHVYACYGATYREYVRRLWPRCRVLTSFAALTRASASEARDRDLPFDLLLLGQELEEYGVRDEERIYRRVLQRLDELSARRGLRVRVKLHPKQRLPPALEGAFPAIEFTRDGELADMLSTRLGAVISFNSTGLLEAAHVGCPIVAIRAPGVPDKYNAPYAEMIDLETFAGGWELDSYSRVRAGEMDDE